MKNKPLLKEVIKTKKPIIISCGMTNLDEIGDLVNFLDETKLTMFYSMWSHLIH